MEEIGSFHFFYYYIDQDHEQFLFLTILALKYYYLSIDELGGVAFFKNLNHYISVLRIRLKMAIIMCPGLPF